MVEIDEEVKINENSDELSSKMIKSKDAKTVVDKISKSLPTPAKSYENSSKKASKNHELLTPLVPKLDTSKTRTDTGKQKRENSPSLNTSPMRLRNKQFTESLSSPHGHIHIEIDIDGIGVLESRSQKNKNYHVDDDKSDRGGAMVSNQADPGKKLQIL